jgi:hypothetical protein
MIRLVVANPIARDAQIGPILFYSFHVFTCASLLIELVRENTASSVRLSVA